MNYEEELDLTSEGLPVESDITVTDAEEEPLDLFSSISESIIHGDIPSLIPEDLNSKKGDYFQDTTSEVSSKMTLEENISVPKKLIASGDIAVEENFAVTSAHVGKCLADPISSKLAAVHHVSQAIKSLRWKRQLKSTEPENCEHGGRIQDRPPSSINFSVCACGDADCIEVCDIREWLPTTKLDHKLWKLVLLLGESYLVLGEAYKEDGQLHQALKVVELACAVYGSMPRHLGDTVFISSMVSIPPSQTELNDGRERLKSSSSDDCLSFDRLSSTYLFWAKAWTLVGDVYVEFHMIKGTEVSIQAEKKPCSRELKMSSEVMKEVKRLKKKLGQYKQNCSSCSLVNCSCQNDRASSGSSASSSSGDKLPFVYGRKPSKRSYSRSNPYTYLEKTDGDLIHNKLENRSSESQCLQHHRDDGALAEASHIITDKPRVKSLEATNCKRVESTNEIHDTQIKMADQSETALGETPKTKNGGIFKYLGVPVVGDADYNLSAALSCYEEAIRALGGLPTSSAELQSVIKKKGWVCNELGRRRLERKELENAEVAFVEAINAFKEVSDHMNLILINCNLGHGRRALAEEMVSKIESLKVHVIFRDAYNQALETAKLEYRESLRYYGAAKAKLSAITEEADSDSTSLRNEVYTQIAHTYLRLGMLLAREDTVAEIYEKGAFEDATLCYTSSSVRKHEISANDAFREALSFYESLGELRQQEAAYAYFQLACSQRDCCLKFLESNNLKGKLLKGENSIPQRIKQYASLAERNWQKSIDFYGPKTHATMYLTILMERSALSLRLSSYFHSNTVCSLLILFSNMKNGLVFMDFPSN